MSELAESDIVGAIGLADELIVREVLKTGASARELHCAVALVCGPPGEAGRRIGRLSLRMLRLVDLVGAALERRGNSRTTGAAAPARSTRRAA